MMITMKTVVAVPVLIAAALTLASCSAAPQPEETLRSADYEELVTELPSFNGADLDQLRAMSHNICDLLNEQPKPKGYLYAVKALTDGGFTGGDSGAFITYSVAAYCPALSDKMLLPEDLP